MTTTASCNRFRNRYSFPTRLTSDPSYTFTASANRTLVANFALNTYTIAASSSPSAGGTLTGRDTVSWGSSHTVTSTAASGYSISNWTENGTVVSSLPSYTFTAHANR